ncbi:helix-turn-helix domain-containing protein [Lentzea guizhouensis]|uniref:helix-turn-helix domain-containing protein n=1 Tax=Lentzea guizhouensis TaxID=1586287 RepID=UPI003002A1E7
MFQQLRYKRPDLGGSHVERRTAMDSEDLSAFLGVPVHTIRGWRTKNYGPPARRVGKHLRWDPAKMREWFNSAEEA